MKKLIPLLLLAALLLSACVWEDLSPSREPYTWGNDGKTYYIDPEAGTITCGAHTYRFEIERTTITITYPNGARYIMTVEQELSYGGYTMDFDTSDITENGYENGEDLMAAVEQYLPSQDTQTVSGTDVLGILCGLALCGVGLWGLLAPHSAWYVSHGWRYKDAEPSDTALMVEGVVGVIAIVGGIIIIVLSL